MNKPKRKKVKTKSAPGNRHLDRTKPFKEPRIVEIAVAGITSLKLLPKLGDRSVQAVRQPARVQAWGNVHAWLGSVSAAPLKLVTIRTYTGIRTITMKTASSAYFARRA